MQLESPLDSVLKAAQVAKTRKCASYIKPSTSTGFTG